MRSNQLRRNMPLHPILTLIEPTRQIALQSGYLLGKSIHVALSLLITLEQERNPLLDNRLRVD